MTQLCYSIEEAAKMVDMSEPVLVRLSQFFKVPESGYEDVGYLSFKGDLVFTDADIHFFKQVKERILQGETIETIRDRIRFDTTANQPTANKSTQVNLSEKSPYAQPSQRFADMASDGIENQVRQDDTTSVQSKRGKSMPKSRDNAPIGLSRLRMTDAVDDHQSLKPQSTEEPNILKQAAEQSLEQYKLRRTPLHQEATLEDLAEQMQGRPPYSEPMAEAMTVPSWKEQFKKVLKKPIEKSLTSTSTPMTGSIVQPITQPLATPLTQPLNVPSANTGRSPQMAYAEQVETQRRQEVRLRLDQLKQKLSQTSSKSFTAKMGASTPWQTLINEGHQHKREVAPRLQQAAAMLKEKAMKKTQAYHSF